MTCLMHPQAAVLTGDLIGSTEAAPQAVEAAMHRIRALAAQAGPATRFARYRGDGWQIYLANPGLGLGLLLLIAANLRAVGGVESRIALGLGTARIDAGEGAAALASASGGAFVASGRALDHMAPPQRLALAGDGVDRLHARLMAFIDERVAGWSVEQAGAMALALAPGGLLTQVQMAKTLGISRQAVAARLQSGGFALLNGAAIDFLRTFGPEPDPDE